MIMYHIFPDAKRKIVTFSFDDGHVNDERLAELFRKYGVKATFHLNAKNYPDLTEERIAELREIYRTHEISCHTYHHGWPTRMPSQSLVNEIMDERKILEKIAGEPVTGMSYPYGDYDEKVKEILSICGIVYSRNTHPTNIFDIPTDFLAWRPTCHHFVAEPLIDKFFERSEKKVVDHLFYIWGHSYELNTDERWTTMERILFRLSGNEKIWYATNMEIYRYMTAQRRLVISADETVFYNPTDIDVYVEKDREQEIFIPAGKTVRI